MNIASIVLIVLMGGGYWFSGDQREITVQWVSPKHMPAAELRWMLMLGEVKLSSGTLTMPEGEKSTRIRLKMPEVRAHTRLSWHYEVARTDTGKTLESGEMPIHLFSRDFLAGWGKAVANRKLLVCDDEGSLAKWLDGQGNLKYERITSLDALPIAGADLIVVGENQISDQTFAQAGLLQQAQAGASVLVLAQRGAAKLADLPVVERSRPTTFCWQLEHRLLSNMDQAMLESMLPRPHDGTVRPVTVAKTEPVLEVASWPRPEGKEGGEAMECLIAVKSVAKGRVVLCQVPLGNCANDPRAQLFLANAIEYLTTAPGPIVPWGERADQQQTKDRESQPMIRLP